MKAINEPVRAGVRPERFRIALVAGLLAATLLTGCGRVTQIEKPNRRLIDSLRTAVSAKNPKWLEQNAKLIDERHAAGQLSDEEHEALAAIVEQARAGEWEAAQSAVVKLSKGQAPVPDEPVAADAKQTIRPHPPRPPSMPARR